MRKVCLITTGGTIASQRDPRSGHVTAGIAGPELRAMLPYPIGEIDVTVDDFCKVVSRPRSNSSYLRTALPLRGKRLSWFW